MTKYRLGDISKFPIKINYNGQNHSGVYWIRENMFLLLETFNYLNNCGLTLLEKEATSALEPYIQRPK
jgi:hypothetical protein